MRDRARAWLARPTALWWLAGLAMLLAAPSLTTGLAGDDYYQETILRGDHRLAGLPSSSLDLFNFASGDPVKMQALIDSGAFPWSADLQLRLAFFRPLSALTHALDHRLWPDSPLLMHAHCLLWLGLSVLLVGAVYRRFLGATWVAGLATLLYAVDDAHGPTVGWIANRNALIAVALALPALLFHDRWRKHGWVPGAWLAATSVALGLCAGESALAVVAYLVAYALCLDGGSTRARLWSLVPYALVVVAWRVVYGHLGYGTHGSGVYVDPGSQPLTFAAVLPTRLPALLLGQLAFPWSDFASLYSFVGWWLLPLMTVVALVVLALFARLFLPLWRDDRVSRFFVSGLLLAALPICATFSADRLLGFVGIGAMGLVAQLVARAETPTQRSVATLLLVYHAGLAPLGLLIRSRSMVTAGAPTQIADATLPLDATIADKTLVLVNPPSDLFAAFLPFVRIIKGEPLPARLRWLVSATDDVTVTRVDERTLRVRPTHGLFANITESLTRNPAVPTKPNTRIDLAGLRVTLPTVTDDGRPAEARFEFDRPLDDPSFVWRKWQHDGYAPFAVPAVGATVTLPGEGFFTAVNASLQRLERAR